MAAPQLIDISAILAAGEASTATTGDDGYGVTEAGFVPKPFARLLAERIDAATKLFGESVDLTSSSVLRKVLELTALEDARTWAAMASMYDASFVSTATADSLSLLGEELGLPRPYEHAQGEVELSFSGSGEVVVPLGTRLLSAGGHHVATLASATVSSEADVRVAVEAFVPGPSQNLDPELTVDGGFPERIESFHPLDAKRPAEWEDITITHAKALEGGGQQWNDPRYRSLLLRAPRSIWTARALAMAIELVPGVRAVKVRDPYGGLDVDKAIFGTFNFIEQLFGSQRNPYNPYQAIAIVAPTEAAIWEGTGGLSETIRAAIDDIRPVGIHPQIVQATQVFVKVSARISVRRSAVGAQAAGVLGTTAEGAALLQRFAAILRRVIGELGFGEPVRGARLVAALMADPVVADVCALELERFSALGDPAPPQDGCETLALGPDEIAVYSDASSELVLEVTA